MRIGIDIDGVLTDVEKYQLDLGSKYFYLKNNKGIINGNAFDTTDIFKIGIEENNEFWNNIIYDYATKEPARKFASEIIKKLKEEGNSIYIITARSNNLSYVNMTKEEMQNIVRNWLKDNDIIYDELIFTPEDKLRVCQENNVDIMIEDKPANIEEVSSKIPVICYNASYNQHCVNNNIIRCYSWYDIYWKIKNYQSK